MYILKTLSYIRSQITETRYTHPAEHRFEYPMLSACRRQVLIFSKGNIRCCTSEWRTVYLLQILWRCPPLSLPVRLFSVVRSTLPWWCILLSSAERCIWRWRAPAGGRAPVLFNFRHFSNIRHGFPWYSFVLFWCTIENSRFTGALPGSIILHMDSFSIDIYHFLGTGRHLLTWWNFGLKKRRIFKKGDLRFYMVWCN